MDTKKLRQKILDLAIHGKLVPQDPNDEPASVLLERIRAEKERLIKEGKIKRSKKSATTSATPHYEKVPDGWCVCQMQDVITFVNGRAYKKEELLSKGKYKVLRVGNFFTNTEWYYSDLELPDDKYCYPGDLLYAWSASFGPQIWNEDKTIFHYHIWNIKYNKSVIIRDYLYYFLLYDKEQIGNSTTGSTMIHVSMENMKPRTLFIPPINEQKRIVNAVDRYFAIIETIETSKSDLTSSIDVAKSKILDLAIYGKLVPQDPNDEPAIELLRRINPKFTPCDNGQYGNIPEIWLSVPLEALFDVNPKSKLEDKMEVGFVPMELVADGYSGTHSFESKKWVEVKKGYSHFVNGDIGVAKISPCFENLKSTLFNNLPNGYGAGTTELVIMRNKGIYPEFYLYLFKSNWYIAQGTKYFKGVVGQQRVNREIFTTLHVPLPPLAEQQRIVKRIEELFATLDSIQSSLEA